MEHVSSGGMSRATSLPLPPWHVPCTCMRPLQMILLCQEAPGYPATSCACMAACVAAWHMPCNGGPYPHQPPAAAFAYRRSTSSCRPRRDCMEPTAEDTGRRCAPGQGKSWKGVRGAHICPHPAGRQAVPCPCMLARHALFMTRPCGTLPRLTFHTLGCSKGSAGRMLTGTRRLSKWRVRSLCNASKGGAWVQGRASALQRRS